MLDRIATLFALLVLGWAALDVVCLIASSIIHRD